jgi:cbb3-type cytochrome oxidase subunit 3
MISFFKHYIIIIKYYIFIQSILCILFFFIFCYIIFIVFNSSDKYCNQVSNIPLDNKKNEFFL